MKHSDSFEKRALLLRSVRVVFFDFDGVFTDNRVSVSQDGSESVVCWRSDGIGLARLAELGVQTAIVSAEANPVVTRRAEKLGISCFAGCSRKSAQVAEVLQDLGFSADHAAFVGNDTPDLEAMEMVGIPIAVADAYPEVLKCAQLVTKRPGGFGAVREICDWIIEARGSV